MIHLYLSANPKISRSVGQSERDISGGDGINAALNHDRVFLDWKLLKTTETYFLIERERKSASKFFITWDHLSRNKQVTFLYRF